MGVGIDGRGYLGQMRVRGLAIAVGHDQARRFAFGRADGAEDIDPFGALVVRRPGPGAPARPTPCDLVFLTDARFVLPPKLYLDTIRETLAELRQLGREVFLKSSNANSFWAWWRGRAVILAGNLRQRRPRRPWHRYPRSGRMAPVKNPRGAGQHHASALAAEIARTQPGREHLAVHPRQLALEPGLHVLSGYPRPLLLRLEQPHRTALGHHVDRATKMGPSVISREGWYKIVGLRVGAGEPSQTPPQLQSSVPGPCQSQSSRKIPCR